MRIEIFNVGHGSAALIIADNHNIVLLDCGHEDRGFRPSEYLPKNWRAIQNFVISHFDSDHVSDLADLVAKMPIETLSSNPSIPVSALRSLKEQEGPLTTGMQALLNMKNSFAPPGSAGEPNLAGIQLRIFYHSYPNFRDMNNLSLIAFIEFDGFCIVFPGDIERAGWIEHLRNPIFTQFLSRVNIFVASHHGRENGYCEEIFQFCRPDLVIISDTSKQYDTQEHCYKTHANGLAFSRNGLYVDRRYVLTTRCDGHIVIGKEVSKPYTVRYA